MAFELRVTISLVDTEPAIPGNPGIVFNSECRSAVVMDSGADSAGAMALCAVKASSMAEDALLDFKGQAEVWETNFRRRQA
jgi:hypothetical protein